MKIKIVTRLLILAIFMGCSHSPKVVFPDKGYENVEWSKKEKEKNIAIRHLFRNEYSSSHLIRIRGKELPHYHDGHNLTVSVLSGKSIVHFRNHEVVLYEGDVINIPKGIYHWAENIDGEASVVLATFSPAFNGKDKRLADVVKHIKLKWLLKIQYPKSIA
jgi:mannose-6-phosphate isomerase-like protein (cupin superfamily)